MTQETVYPLLESALVRLRCLEPEDLELLYTIENDPRMWEVGLNRRPYSYYALRQYIAQQPHDFFQDGELRLVVEERASGQAVGLIDLANYSPVDRRAEVGIALLAERRGEGLGGSALDVLERYAARVLHVRLLYALVMPEGSPASRNLFQRAGYALCGHLPGWHLYRERYADVEIYLKNIEKKCS